jgi:hypothetical protein
MDFLLMFFLLASPVPAVSAGPDLIEHAELIKAPIADVTVYNDRARVVRKAKLAVKKGIHKLKFPELPGAIMTDTVRVVSKQVSVLRIEVIPIQKERFALDQVEVQVERLEKLTSQIELLDAKRQVASLELGLLSRLSPKTAPAEHLRKDLPAFVVVPKQWKVVLDFLEDRKNKVRDRIRKLDLEKQKQNQLINALRQELNQYNTGGFSDRKIQVVAIVESKKNVSADLELEYFAGGASWWPKYNLYFMPKVKKIRLQTSGHIRQATGEDWNNVAIHLSTAIPGHGIELPKLLTWTLGEKSEYIPRARAASQSPTVRLHPAPQATATLEERKQYARLEVLRNRLARLSVQVAAARPAAKRYQPAPPPQPAMDLAEEMDFEAAPTSSRSRAAPSAMPRASRLRRASVQKKARAKTTPTKSISLAFLDVRRSPLDAISDKTLPAVAAGGLDYVYDSLTPASIASSNKRIEVPLYWTDFKAKTHYEATPALKETVFLKAMAKNTTKTPILTGPVNIFLDKDFVGEGRIQTTGSGGILEFPLGADENIKIKRNIIPSSLVEGVFSKDEVTTYKVKIEVVNHHKHFAEVVVRDQIPKSGHEDIEVKVEKTMPKPIGPDADGVLEFTVVVPAAGKKVIEFEYRITRPEDMRLYQ